MGSEKAVFASGCLFVSRSTGRMLLFQRPPMLDFATTWSLSRTLESSLTRNRYGGVFTGFCTPLDNCKNHIKTMLPENMCDVDFPIIPLWLHKTYFAFAAVVDHEFTPRRNAKFMDFTWFSPTSPFHWPSPLHPELKRALEERPGVLDCLFVTPSISAMEVSRWSLRSAPVRNISFPTNMGEWGPDPRNPNDLEPIAHMQSHQVALRKKAEFVQDWIKLAEKYTPISREFHFQNHGTL